MNTDDARGVGEVLLLCECGHGLDEHNSLGCYARLSYTPLVTCECKLTDDRTHADLLAPNLARLIEQREAAARAEGADKMRRFVAHIYARMDELLTPILGEDADEDAGTGEGLVSDVAVALDRARAEGRREVREAVERLLAGGPDTWTGYESCDTGWTFLADSVLDFTADLRAVLAGQGGESGEGASLRMQYEASQEALSRCLAENRENRQAADYRLILLHAVLSCVDTHPEYDLPLTLLEAIRHETSSGDADSGGQA